VKIRGLAQNCGMDVAYAIPVLLALVAALLAVRHIVRRQRRMLDRYRQRRARQPRTFSPKTDSARSEMRAQENPTTTLGPTTAGTNGPKPPSGHAKDRPRKA